MSAQTSSTSTFNRADTLLGICEAIGQDLGFNAQWLRIALAMGVFWSPVAMIALYFALGVAVWVARAVTPVRTGVVARSPVVAGNDDQVVTLAEAA